MLSPANSLCTFSLLPILHEYDVPVCFDPEFSLPEHIKPDCILEVFVTNLYVL